MFKRSLWPWWLTLLGIWGLSTYADRLWLAADLRLPAWDQADYLNNALDHGRSLGFLGGDGWHGWTALLDLSPKIPPLSPLVSATVMALAGEQVDAASWVLSLWHGVLLLSVGLWGRQLLNPSFGLLSAALTALAPAIAGIRVDFTLDMPVTATCCLALWLLWRWHRPHLGGQWSQALLAAVAIGAAILVKQSALLVIAPPAVWELLRSHNKPTRRRQGFAALTLVITMLLPWLHHNWITTLGGTERAVIRSGMQEGDPGILDPRSVIWYPALWLKQLGATTLIGGIGGLTILARKARHQNHKVWSEDWGWLLGVTISGWIFISLSPNKDPRYILPVLPLMIILLARGWWEIGSIILNRYGFSWAICSLAAGLCSSALICLHAATGTIQRQPRLAATQAIEALSKRVGKKHTTLLTSADKPDLNEHTLTFLGQTEGRRIKARKVTQYSNSLSILLQESHWWLLRSPSGKPGSDEEESLNSAVRLSGYFKLVDRWPWKGNQSLELWQRQETAPKPRGFAARFIAIARSLEQGAAGLRPVFENIEVWHALDPDFTYQKKVHTWSHAQLSRDPASRDALWSLALLAVLRNRPQEANFWFARLEGLDGAGDWASAYRSVVLLADWNSCKAARVADGSRLLTLRALRDLSRSLCFDPRGMIELPVSLPPAVRSILAGANHPQVNH